MEPSEEIRAEESPLEPVAESKAEETPVKPIEEIQTEDSRVVEEPKPEPVKTDIVETPKKKSFWSKVLIWFLVALVFFIGGVATLFFVVYQPAKEAAKAAAETSAQKITSLTENFDKAIKQFGAAQTELDVTKGELMAAQSQIEDLTTELANANQLEMVYKFIADVNLARVKLETLDVNSSRQAINFAKADLADLQATGIDPDSISGFSASLDEANTNLSQPDLLKSREALNNLYSSLLLLVNNLPQ